MASHSKPVLARSLEAADVGEALYISRQGAVVRPWWLRLPRWAWVVALFGGGMLLAELLLATVGPAAWLVWMVLAVPITIVAAWRQRHVGRLRQAVALSVSGRLDEAYAVLSALERRRLSPRVRLATEMRLGAVTWQRGALEEAKVHLDRAIESHRRGVEHVLARFMRAELSAVQGDIDDARRRESELAELAGLFHGDLFTACRQSLALVIAFHGNDPDGLPDRDTLYIWAKEALARTRFGGMLVTLSWAFARRGDAEMAQHLLQEAPARLTNEHLAKTHPRVQAYLERVGHSTEDLRSLPPTRA